MSFAIDVDILLYASDRSSPLHENAAAFVEACAGGRQVFCLGWVTVMSYVRMATHPSMFQRPLTHAEGTRTAEALMNAPACRVLAEVEGFSEVYRDVVSQVPTRGNPVPDAHLAALLLQRGVLKLYTHGRDFRKFAFLDVHDPLA
jgi:toxin-antitoxin system PIN domain toxin